MIEQIQFKGACLKSVGKNFGDVNETFNYIFKELFSVPILKKVIDEYRGIPRPKSSAKDDLLKHITGYIKKNFPKENLYSKFIEFVVKSVDSRSLRKVLDEPNSEADLKPIMKEALKQLGYTPYDKEVKIPPATRADVVGYKRRYDIAEKGWWIFKEEERIPYYEFIGIELKTAKRSKDPLFRQASIYTDYFDYSFTAITPLSMLKHGYEFIERFYREMRTIGMGIVLVDAHNPIGTILSAKEGRPKERNRNISQIK